MKIDWKIEEIGGAMSENGREYVSASIDASVTVKSYRGPLEEGGFHAGREVKLGFNESFLSDDELDVALERFVASIKAAARRA